ERQQLMAHVATCDACQRRLNAFERIGQTLLRQREPNIQAQVWRGLYPQLAGTAVRSPTQNRGPLLRGGLGVAAAVVLVALFGVVLVSRLPGRPANPAVTNAVPTATTASTQTTTSSPTVPTNVLNGGWRATQAGAGVSLDIAFAPSLPATGYAV